MKTKQFFLSVGYLLLSHVLFAQSTNGNLASQQKALDKQQENLERQEKALQKQEKDLTKATNGQKDALEKQKLSLEKQKLSLKEKSKELKIQKKILNSVEDELVKDGFVQRGENYELTIGNKEMMINGRKQSDRVHQKYIKFIEKMTKKPFGNNELFKIKE